MGRRQTKFIKDLRPLLMVVVMEEELGLSVVEEGVEGNAKSGWEVVGTYVKMGID